MNLKSTLIIILCFTLLSLGTFFSYKKFYPSIINPKQKNQQEINFDQLNSGIYFQSGSSYYLANTNISFERLFLPDKTLVQKDSTNVEIFKEANPSTLKSITTKNGTYLLKKEMINSQETVNLYFNDIKTNTSKAITMVASPLIISGFEISSDTNSIVYQIYNTKTGQSNIDISNNDGANLLELTSDGISFFPVFSPDGSKIAFWQKNQGIYIMSKDGTSPTKILNYQLKINQIFTWR